MPVATPVFTSLKPSVLDANRIVCRLTTENFPPRPNVNLRLELSPAETTPAAPPSNPNQGLVDSPYPNVEVSLQTQDHYELAATFIVEHQETEVEVTLYTTELEHGATYIAKATMYRNDEIIATIQTTFVYELPAPTSNSG